MLSEKKLLYRSIRPAEDDRNSVLKKLNYIFLITLTLAVSAAVGTGADEEFVKDRIERPVNNAIDIRQKSQAEQEQWHREKQEKTSVYESLEAENIQLKERQKRLEQSRKALLDRIEAKKLQLDQIEQIAEQISPCLLEVFGRLDSFFKKDMPFLKEERTRRIVNLEQVLADPDITVSEKTRKIMEALLVEAEYGQTIEVTRGSVDIAGKATLVDIFRFGRIALFYRTLDGQDCGFFNVADNSWQPLSGSYTEAIGAVIEIGAKRRPAELLSLPIGRISVQ